MINCTIKIAINCKWYMTKLFSIQFIEAEWSNFVSFVRFTGFGYLVFPWICKGNGCFPDNLVFLCHFKIMLCRGNWFIALRWKRRVVFEGIFSSFEFQQVRRSFRRGFQGFYFIWWSKTLQISYSKCLNFLKPTQYCYNTFNYRFYQLVITLPMFFHSNIHKSSWTNT